MLSLIDRRYHQHATIIVSQFEPPEWLDQIPIPVAAEAITDYRPFFSASIQGHHSGQTVDAFTKALNRGGHLLAEMALSLCALSKRYTHGIYSIQNL